MKKLTKKQFTFGCGCIVWSLVGAAIWAAIAILL